MSSQNSQAHQSPPAVKGYCGQVVYIYSYDLAYDMTDQPIERLLGQPTRQFAAGPFKPGPREVLFYRPQMVTLPPVVKTGPHGPVTITRSVKIFPLGAISVAVSVPFQVQHSGELIAYHDLAFADGSLHDQVMELAQNARKELEPYCVRQPTQLKDEEAYTVFCINAPLLDDAGEPLNAEDWLTTHRRQVAALLTQEMDAAHLSDQESVESTAKYLSYYQQDMAVIDWDAAILIDRPENFDEVLHIIELANVQLIELEAYDRTMDDVLQGSYRDLAKRRLTRRSNVLSSLREMRLDMARLSDELFNTTKFFGDWHLARVYQSLSARFHLDDWQRVIENKLKTLDSLYQILKQDQLNYLMLVLEITIVLLFIIDLVLLLIPAMR